MKHKVYKPASLAHQLKEQTAHIESLRGALSLATERQNAADRRSEALLAKLDTAQYDLHSAESAFAEFKNKLMLYFMARSSGSVDNLRLHQLECALVGAIAPMSSGGKF